MRQAYRKKPKRAVTMSSGVETSQSYLKMLAEIARILATLDLDEVLRQLINLTTEAVGAARGTFFLIDEQGNTLQRFLSARNLAPDEREKVSQQVLSGGLAGWVISHQQSALIRDTANDERWMVLDGNAEMQRVRSAICIPFFVEGDLRGIMTLEHPAPNHFTDDHLGLVEAAAHQASASLRNAQLFDRVQTQQRQLQAVLNSISDAILVLDSLQMIRLGNPAAWSLFGFSESEMLYRSLNDLAAGTDNPFFAELAQGVLVAQESGVPRFELRDEAARRDFIVHVTRIDRSNATESGYVIALNDVSHLKDLNRLKNHMIRMASHDLKNPINVLRGYLDVMRAEINVNHSLDPSYLEAMGKALTRMEGLIVNLLDMQRAEEAEPFKREIIEANDLVESVIEDMLPSIRLNRHNLVQNIQAQMRTFVGDYMRIREAMNNLIDNAVKYTPSGGTITVNASTEDDRFSFSVRDTGFGIPEDQQPHIFQPFFRAQATATSHIAGTGVGLNLVKEVIERQGGQVWFNSRESQGSIFGFWLPILT